MLDASLGQIASASLLGALLVVALFALWWKDKQLSEEKTARINDRDEHLKLVMALQGQVITAVNKLTDLVEIQERRNERIEAAAAAAHAAQGGTPYQRHPTPLSGSGRKKDGT